VKCRASTTGMKNDAPNASIRPAVSTNAGPETERLTDIGRGSSKRYAMEVVEVSASYRGGTKPGRGLTASVEGRQDLHIQVPATCGLAPTGDGEAFFY
jgi:hypothetical protein